MPHSQSPNAWRWPNTCRHCDKNCLSKRGLRQHIDSVPACKEFYHRTKQDLTLRYQRARSSSSGPHPYIPSAQVDVLLDDLPTGNDSLDPQTLPVPDSDCRARVEDAEDEENPHDNHRKRFATPYPDPAGIPSSAEQFATAFERYCDTICGQYGPFDNEDDWELGKFLMENLGQGKTDEFLKLGKVRYICDI